MHKLKEGLISLTFIFLFILNFNLISATGVSLAGDGTVTIAGADDLYAYEVNFDYTGTISSVTFGNFLGAGTSSGYTKRNDILSVYETKLDKTAAGVDGAGTLFDVDYTGKLGLESVVLIKNDTTEEVINYACGNGICSSNEDCSSCSADCGACPVSPGGGDGGGGGGGGGGGTAAPPVQEGVKIDTEEIVIYLVLNSNKERIIKVNNIGEDDETINLRQFGLDDFVVFDEDFFTLPAGKSKDVRVRFLSGSKTGIFTGKMFIGGNPVLVSINVATKELLFDALVAVPEDKKQLSIGDNLDVQITLIPMGENPRVDVTLNYIIKDFEGEVFLSESETVLIEEQRTFEKEFFTDNLPVGNYIVGLELVYPNGVATSSSHFEIIGKEFNLRIVIIVLIAGIVIATFVITILLLRRKKRNRRR